MSPKEVKALVKTLRAMGVTQYKSADIELVLTPETPAANVKKTRIAAKEEKQIKHKVEELTSLLKMGDQELIDRLFPDHQQEVEEEIGIYS